MFIYYGKRFQAESAGAVVLGVDCDKCAQRYYYELARIGAGAGTAHFGIAAYAAERSAEAASESDLQKRLKSEAELVPCPNCHWISHDLVRGYRRTRYRPVAKLALGIAFFGTVTCLIAAWYLRGSFGGDSAQPYVLYGGPAFFLTLGAVLMLLCWCLRSLIRPNRNYPRAPKLPFGTPPALLLDEESNELRRAQTQPSPETEGQDWLDIQVGRHVFPLLCCGCLRPATKQHAAVVPLFRQVNGLEIPQCASCARTSGKGPNRTILVVIGLFIAVGVASLFILEANTFSLFLLSLLAVLCMVVATLAKFLPPRGPAYVLKSDLARGVVRLRFRNLEYARMLAKYFGGGDSRKSAPEPTRSPSDAFTAEPPSASSYERR